jgi:D-alanine-D-alanine ligase
MKKEKIIVLCGGFSPEREISLKTGEGVFNTLHQDEKYAPIMMDPADFSSYEQMILKIKEISPTIVFNALHGEEGENGKLQAMFDLEKISYTGSGHLASAISMNKFIANKLVESLKIPVPKSILINKKNFDIQNVKIESYPIVIKPNDKGSSVGISIVEKHEQLKEAFDFAFEVSDNVLIEEYIPGRELTVTVLGQKTLPVVEIIPKQGWYDFKNKYTKGNSEYQVPAKLTTKEKNTISKYALTIYNIIGCQVYSRIDFRYNGESFYFLEVNTLPGMTPLSLTPKAANAAGINFSKLLDFIIQESKRRRL